MSLVNLPAVRFQYGRPAIIDSVSVSRVGDRSISYVEYADPFWQIPMRTEPLRASKLVLVEAFASLVRAGKNSVLFIPTHICTPQFYWGNPNAPALANNGNLVSVSNGFNINLNSVDNGLRLMSGDLFSLAINGYRSLHRVVTGGVAAGNAISLVVEPQVPGYITAGAVAKFKNPELNTRVVPGSFVIPDDPKPVATFTLVEVPK